MNNKILLSYPHMGGTEQKYINEAFEDNWIAPLGENVDKFEESIAEYVGSKGGASALCSGTAALHLALRLLDINRDDIVFVQSFTFIASVNPILYEGAIPVFIDSEPETWNMSPVALKKALEDAKDSDELPKAIIVVNLYGQVAKFKELKSIADEYNVPIIEDAAESLGSKYYGQMSGTLGEIGAFSFNGNKIITTSGGGALVSSNKEYVDYSRFLATQARDTAPYYQHSVIGYNYRLSNISAGIGRGQMEVLSQRVEKRRAIFKKYSQAFSNIEEIEMMPEINGHYSNRWLSTLTLKNINNIEDIVQLLNELNEKNIEARALWKPMHSQPLFDQYKFFRHYENDSVSEKLFNSGLCLPSASNMTEEEQDYVISVFKKVVSNI